jgi:very-short-patch-repair endonuclease
MEVLQHCCPHKIDLDFRPCGYIVDGYVHELKLVIEFDEAYHDSPEQQIKDHQREENIAREVPAIRFFRVREADWSADPQRAINDFGNVVYP